MLRKVADVHHFPLSAENIGESSLVRHPLHERKLATLESAANARSGPGLLALGTAA